MGEFPAAGVLPVVPVLPVDIICQAAGGVRSN